MIKLLILYYFKWLGNLNELKEYIEHLKRITGKIEGVKIDEILMPSNGWNFIIAYKATDLDTVIEVHKEYQIRYGPSKALLYKIELMYTPQELGIIK